MTPQDRKEFIEIIDERLDVRLKKLEVNLENKLEQKLEKKFEQKFEHYFGLIQETFSDQFKILHEKMDMHIEKMDRTIQRLDEKLEHHDQLITTNSLDVLDLQENVKILDMKIAR
jgi:hypothetical protein